ncbi:MAG: hypothetical protein Tsb0020_37340 [Haliangiales bacterium]
MLAALATAGPISCQCQPYPSGVADHNASATHEPDGVDDSDRGGDGASDPNAEPRAVAEGEAASPAPSVAARSSPLLRADPNQLDIGQTPIRNPLNLYDVGLEGAPSYEVVGTIDGEPVTMRHLEAQSVGAFARIAERIYLARERGWRWLIERVSLETHARAAKMPLIPFLLADYARLPAPSAVQLSSVGAQLVRAELSPDERRAAQRTLWRLSAWRARRSELVNAGRAELQFERIRQRISDPSYDRPDTPVARLDGEPITRADLRALAGYQAGLARHEYWRIAKRQFENYVDRYLIARESQATGLSDEQLTARYIDKQPAISAADVRAFIADNPEYAADPAGDERARENLRRLREVRGRDQLRAELRAGAEVRFLLTEPEFASMRLEVPAPRWHGPPSAEHVLVAFHAVGCRNCERGSALLQSIMRARPGQLRILAGDYFEADQLDSYRGALALHCAPPEARDALLAALTSEFGSAEIAWLTAHARDHAGIDDPRFQACLSGDQLLPLIVENVAMAERLGLRDNIPGLFAAGVRIGDLSDLDSVLAQIDAALASE